MAGFRHRPVSIRSERARPLPCKATPDLRPPRFDDDWRQRRRQTDSVPFLLQKREPGALSPHGGRRKGLFPAHGPSSSAASRRQTDSVPFLLRKTRTGSAAPHGGRRKGPPCAGPRILRRFAPASGFRSFPLAKMRTGGALSPHCSPFCREAGAPLRSASWFDRLWKRPRPGLRGCGLFVFPGKRRLYGPSFAAVSAPIFSKRTGCVRFPGSRSTVLAAPERRLRARAPCRRRCTQSSCRPGGRSASAPPPCAASLR